MCLKEKGLYLFEIKNVMIVSSNCHNNGVLILGLNSTLIPNLARKRNQNENFKKMLLGLLALIALSLIGGYFYFEKRFSPPQNYLTVSGLSEGIPMVWQGNDENPYEAILLPVRIDGIDKLFYMQLDLGSPVTVFYKNSLQSVKARFPDRIPEETEKAKIALDFSLRDMKVSSKFFEVLDYGTKADFENPDAQNIIGTLGTDLLEKGLSHWTLKTAAAPFLKKEKVLVLKDLNLRNEGFSFRQ